MKSIKYLQKLFIVLVLASIFLMGFDGSYPYPKNTGISSKINITEGVTGRSASLVNIDVSQVMSAQTAATFKVIKITRDVKHGNFAVAVISTTPGATCLLNYRSPRGRLVKRGVLNKPILANKKGICRWKWRIGRGSLLGPASIVISVNGAEKVFPIVIR